MSTFNFSLFFFCLFPFSSFLFPLFFYASLFPFIFGDLLNNPSTYSSLLFLEEKKKKIAFCFLKKETNVCCVLIHCPHLSKESLIFSQLIWFKIIYTTTEREGRKKKKVCT